MLDARSDSIKNAVAPISPDPPANKGLDYAFLRAEGIRLVQELSGSVWTDYNEHDPGVTTLEMLCYALTELSHRAEMPLADLLADPESGALRPRRHGMLTIRRAFPCNPVGVDDYRKLILDRVLGVGNVWFDLSPPLGDDAEARGLYDVVVYAPDDREDQGAEKPKRLLRRVRRTYEQRRNLCEDIRSIRLLTPLSATVVAEVEVGRNEVPERVLANVLFALELLFAPEPRMRSLSSLLEAGTPPSRIFEGPLLRRGFIDDGELAPRRDSLSVNEAIRAIGGVAGVVGVRNVQVEVDGRTYGPNEVVRIPDDRYLRVRADRSGGESGFSIRLMKNGVVCQPDANTVKLELRMRWADHRREYPLDEQYEEYLGTPPGRWRDLGQYYSIQNHYPAVYQVGADGMPSDVTPTRRAQAKQLKGYLLPFEQLMTDYFAQLAHVGDLFSIDPDLRRTYFVQSLVGLVPDVEGVLAGDYLERLQEIVESEDAVMERRSRFLGFLLALYAEDLHPGFPSDGDPESDAGRLVRAQTDLLRVLARSTRDRGRAPDVRGDGLSADVAGMEYKCRVQMGLPLDHGRTVGETLARSNIKLAGEGNPSTVERSEGRRSSHREGRFRRLSSWARPSGIRPSPDLLRGMTITEELIETARNPAHLFVGRFPDEDEVLVTLGRPSEGPWVLLGSFDGQDEAIRAGYALCLFLQDLGESLPRLYVVEHLLLRFGAGDLRTGAERFDYDFTLTVVVALLPQQRDDDGRRAQVETIVRENVPAHIAAEVCFLGFFDLHEFEKTHHHWREALRGDDPSILAEACARLRWFLERHRGDPRERA